MIRDDNRNLQKIDYNYLNLPQQICYGKQDAGKMISYIYATDGTKVKELYATGTNNILSPIGALNTNVNHDIIYSDSTIYCDNNIYRKGRLDRILLPDGYIQAEYMTIRGRLVAFYKYYYIMKDHQGSARINIEEENLDHRPSEGGQKALSYYPFGKAMNTWTKWVCLFREPYTYTGKKEETMHNLGWYNYGKRFYDPNYRLSFVSVDPLCEKYYSISPYAYCVNNPIRYIDYRGDSISLAVIQQLDQAINANYTQAIVNDLQSQTGLIITVALDGKMSYAKDANGRPVIATTNVNGKTVQTGSVTARTLMTRAIDHQDWVNVVPAGRSGVPLGTNELRLSINQIGQFVSGAANLDNRTLGWGMTFMHELHHTQVGGGLSDSPGNPGPVVTQMNIVRSELNNLGGNYGQRLNYNATPIGLYNYIPFNVGTQGLMNTGLRPVAIFGDKYIKFK